MFPKALAEYSTNFGEFYFTLDVKQIKSILTNATACWIGEL